MNKAQIDIKHKKIQNKFKEKLPVSRPSLDLPFKDNCCIKLPFVAPTEEVDEVGEEEATTVTVAPPLPPTTTVEPLLLPLNS